MGPGAIGATMAACLHEAGRPVRLYGRRARHQIGVRPDGEPALVVPGPVRTDPALVAAPAEVVVLAVKSTQVPAAAPWLAALCDAGTIVYVLQNGIEQRETVAKYAGQGAVVPSIVWFAAETQPGGWVWLRDAPRLTLPQRPESGGVGRGARGLTVLGRADRGFPQRRLAQAAAERGRGADGADRAAQCRSARRRSRWAGRCCSGRGRSA